MVIEVEIRDDKNCVFVSNGHHSLSNRPDRCGLPGVEFTTDQGGQRWWYCAEHWDAYIAWLSDGGLTRDGRPWHDHTEEFLNA